MRQITIAMPRADDGMAVFRNVPAEVCLDCGETRFSLNTTGRIIAVVRERAPDEMAVVPVYDMLKAGR